MSGGPAASAAGPFFVGRSSGDAAAACNFFSVARVQSTSRGVRGVYEGRQQRETAMSRTYIYTVIAVVVVICLAIWGYGGRNTTPAPQPAPSNLTRPMTPHPKSQPAPANSNTPQNTAPTVTGENNSGSQGVVLPKKSPGQ